MTDGESKPSAPVVLIVDDEPDLQQLLTLKFRRRIRKGELRFHFASHGAEALERLLEYTDVDMVVTDINMPVMDGLTLLGQLREQHPMVKAVVVSAYGDMDNIRGAMNRGAYDFLTKPLDFSDFETTVSKTVTHVRELRESIKNLEENKILKLFVDEAALHFMQANDDEAAKSEVADCSVAFIDLCSFTKFSEENPPEVVIRLLNGYFEAIVEAVLPFGGTIDKFIGDAVMVIFRGDDHVQRAAEACLAVRDAVRGVASALKGETGFDAEVSIGLNTGQALLGPVGAQSLGRLDFTVIGDMVNTAARLQGFSEAGGISITAETRALLGDRFRASDKGVVTLKGKSEPVHVFNIDGILHG